MKLSGLSILFLLLLSFASCSENKNARKVSFYHWKAEMDISKTEMEYMNSLSVEKLYIRFFDVKWDSEKKAAIPVSKLEWKLAELGKNLEIVPVVFITNSSIQQQKDNKAIDLLAENISKKLKSMIFKLDSTRFTVKEIQLDCDWSRETQAKYFRLILQIKKNLPDLKRFSATIRLHQVKYFTTTGVPPVDEGVLMFYNMGDLNKQKEKNSILNLEKAKTYLQNFDVYPLKMDVALPLFSWAVQFREGRVVQLINDLSAKDLEENKNFKMIEKNRYLVLNSCYLNGIYIYKNDQIRLEGIEEKDLEASIELLKKAFEKKEFNLIFYHLDDYIVNRFDHNLLKKLAEN